YSSENAQKSSQKGAFYNTMVNIFSLKKYPNEINTVFQTPMPSADQPTNHLTGMRMSPAGMDTIVRSTGIIRHSASPRPCCASIYSWQRRTKERNFSLLPNSFSMIGSPPQ